MSKFASGAYVVRNAQKYVGRGVPRYRSSWEWAFMNFCDTNENVLQWEAGEAGEGDKNYYTT